MITIKKHVSKMKFNEFIELGLKPECLICENSKAKGYNKISCKIKESKIVESNQNIYEKECEYFVTDIEGIFTMISNQKKGTPVFYRGKIITRNF